MAKRQDADGAGAQEKKQANFRLDPETADIFREFCQKNGFTQAQGFAHLIQILELDNAKGVMPGQAANIENFQMLQRKTLEAFMHSLELTLSTEDRVREEFQRTLDQQSKTIDGLHEKIQSLKESLETAKANMGKSEAAKMAADEKARYAAEQMETAKKAAEDKERINSMLTMQLAEATEKLSGYEDMRRSESEMSSRVAELERKLEDDARENENRIELMKLQSQIAVAQAVAEKEKELQEKLREADREVARMQARIEQLTNA